MLQLLLQGSARAYLETVVFYEAYCFVFSNLYVNVCALYDHKKQHVGLYQSLLPDGSNYFCVHLCVVEILKKKIVATICARLCAVEILKKNYVTILAIDISKAFRII